MLNRLCPPCPDHSQTTKSMGKNTLLKSAKTALNKFDRMMSMARKDQMTRSTTAGRLSEHSQEKIEVPAFPVLSFDITMFIERQPVTQSDQSHIYQGMHNLITKQTAIEYTIFAHDFFEERLKVLNQLLALSKKIQTANFNVLFKAMQYFDHFFFLLYSEQKYEQDLAAHTELLSIEVGLTCLLVSSKMQDYCPLSLELIHELSGVSPSSLIKCEKVFLQVMMSQLLCYDVFEAFQYYQQCMIDSLNKKERKQVLMLVNTKSKYVQNVIMHHLGSPTFLQKCSGVDHMVYRVAKKLIQEQLYQGILDKNDLRQAMRQP